MPDLREHLARAYSARVLMREPYKAVIADIRADATENPDLVTSAQARLAELEDLNNQCGGQLDKRCYASSVHRQVLLDILR